MNYIEQINVFWKLDAEHSFNGNESRLYFYLLNLSNSLYWKNPMTNADGYTATVVGISVNTLKAVRNRLQQAGLITFKPGGQGARNKCQYWIIPAAQVLRNNAGKVSNSDTLSEETLTPYSIPGLEKVDDNSKLKPDKTKLKEKRVAPAKPPPPTSIQNSKSKKESKETELPEPFWNDLVKTWFEFNKKNLNIEPSFAGQDPKIFKRIVQRLKDRAEKKKVEWTATSGTQRLQLFLDAAFNDKWLKDHFLLSNLEKQFDTVIQRMSEQQKKVNGTPSALLNGPMQQFDNTINFLIGRFKENDLDERLVNPEYYDKLVSYNYLKPGMIKPDGDINKQKIEVVMNYIKTKCNVTAAV